MTRLPLRPILLASIGALALAGCGKGTTDQSKEQAVVAKVAAPAGKQWSTTVTKTAEGGYLMGNPDAPIKIIEYASLTCSHCADFSKESHEEIKRDFIDSGRVSLEVRNFIRDPLDAMAAAVAHCSPVDRYFPLQENVFASQAELFAGAQANPKGTRASNSSRSRARRPSSSTARSPKASPPGARCATACAPWAPAKGNSLPRRPRRGGGTPCDSTAHAP